MDNVNLSTYLVGCKITVGEWDNVCPSTKEVQTFPVGTNTTITITLDKYCECSDAPTLTFRRYGTIFQTLTFEKVDSKTYTLTTDFTCGTIEVEYSCLVRCVAMSTYAYIESNLKNCTINVENGEYEPQEKTITLTADNNHEFLITPTILIHASRYEEWLEEFEKVDNTSYQFTVTLISGRDYIITGEASKKAIITDKYGLITVYRPSKDELRQLAKGRWEKVTFEDTKISGVTVLRTPEYEYIDTAKYIVSLMKLPLHLESDTRDKIYFGPYDMHQECDIISGDIITLDFGTVDIIGQYQNSIDYNHTDIQIYLPYVGFTAISPNDFMDSTVGLKYQINVINGESLVILTANGNIMLTISCKVGFDIPFQMGGNEYVNTQIEPNTNYLLETRPFIYVRSHAPANEADLKAPYRETKYYAKLGSLTGFTMATEIDFEVISDFITKPEIDEIIDYLESGVFL